MKTMCLEQARKRVKLLLEKGSFEKVNDIRKPKTTLIEY